MNLQTIQQSLKPAQVFESLDISEGTRREYLYRIDSFLDFINSKGFTPNSLLDYKRYLQNRIDLKASSKQKYLITAKTYLKQLFALGILLKDITGGIKGFKTGNGHIKSGL